MDEATESDPEIPSESAHENLRVIRELMERATVYRAISAMPALVGGLLTMVVAAFQWYFSDAIDRTTFLVSWLAVLIVASALNTWLLFRESKSRSGEFPSQKMIHSLLAMAPPMILLGVFGLLLAWEGEFQRCVLLWVIGYGLGLLATSSFAPASIRQLGWSFLVIGILFMFAFELPEETSWVRENAVASSALLMFVSFGLFHVFYWVLNRHESKVEKWIVQDDSNP